MWIYGDLWGSAVPDLWGSMENAFGTRISDGPLNACLKLHVNGMAMVWGYKSFGMGLDALYLWDCGARPMGIYGVVVAAVSDLWGGPMGL